MYLTFRVGIKKDDIVIVFKVKLRLIVYCCTSLCKGLE